jgi:hypothetical protein
VTPSPLLPASTGNEHQQLIEAEVLAQRLRLAAGGIPVGITNRVGSGKDKSAHFKAMPGGPNKKHPNRPVGPGPRGCGAQYYANTDPEKITEWSRRYPGCNTFIGGFLPDDIVCIDIDHADEFRAACPGMLERLQKLGHPTDKRIGQDRWHIWGRMPEGRRAKELGGKHTWGDAKWSGGLVVSSPSATYESAIPLVSWEAVPRLTLDDVSALTKKSGRIEFAAPRSSGGSRHQEYLELSAGMAARGNNRDVIIAAVMAQDRGRPDSAQFDSSRSGDFNTEVERMVDGAILMYGTVVHTDSGHAPEVDLSALIGSMPGGEKQSPAALVADVGTDAPGTASEAPAATDPLSTPGGIQFISMAELAALPPPNWLIPNLIPDRGLGFIVGKPDAGKSFLLHDLAQSVCRGVPLFGDPKLMPARSGWVFCILPEASASWATRIRAYCDYHGQPYSDQLCACIQGLDLGDTDTWGRVQGRLQAEINRRGVSPVLVILDTFSSAIPGRDENSQSEMTPLMARLHWLVQQGPAVIVAHHTAKYGTEFRGSSVLLGSCDWMLLLDASANGTRELTKTKLRNAEAISSVAFELKVHGESAVCVGTEGQGPWGFLQTVGIVNPGLKEALTYHGLVIPGHDRQQAIGADITEAGVSLKQIKETWRKLRAITPAYAVAPKDYKAADRQRTTALIGIVDALLAAGVLKRVSGKVSKSDRKLGAVVRQEVDHDVD